MAESFGKNEGGQVFEHRDIANEKRPKLSPAVYERVRARFFYDLMEETFRNYDTAKKERPGAEKSPVRNIGFFFKKSWDNFTEPLIEYEDMLADIMAKKWESNGAKSRALNELEERRKKSLGGVTLLVPDFLFNEKEKQKKILAKIYEGYAGFIETDENKLDYIADDVGKGFGSILQRFLRTVDDYEVRILVERRQKKKMRKKIGSFAEDVVLPDAPDEDV
ncbi:MAG: hypothetical protein Q7R91_02545 [bacterium]|nr:hypothetical protein [bacterium]